MQPELRSQLAAHHSDIVALCQTFGVTALALFGSGTREDWRPAESDLDFVVTFSSPSAPGIANRFLGFADGLERLLGRRIDLITEESIRNPYFREAVEQERTVLYAA